MRIEKNEVRHTPGPWKAVLVEGHRLGGRNGAARYDVLAMNPPDFVADRLTEANARLIAAAPDLLAACRAVLECLGRTLAPDYLPETRELLRAAIAKAEGE